MSKRKLMLGLLLILVLISLLGCAKKQQVIAPVQGAQAPDFTITSLTTEKIKLTELLNKPVVLSFWRTDSPPSRRQLRNLTELQGELGDKVHILAINVGEDKQAVTVFLDQNKFKLPVGMDTGKRPVTNTYRIDYMPTTFILDQDGIILKKANGGMSKTEIINTLAKK